MQSRRRVGGLEMQMGQGSFCVVEVVVPLEAGIDGGVEDVSSPLEVAAVAIALFSAAFSCRRFDSRSKNRYAAFERNSGFPPTEMRLPVPFAFNICACLLHATNTQPLGYLATKL